MTPKQGAEQCGAGLLESFLVFSSPGSLDLTENSMMLISLRAPAEDKWPRTQFPSSVDVLPMSPQHLDIELGPDRSRTQYLTSWSSPRATLSATFYVKLTKNGHHPYGVIPYSVTIGTYP